MEINAVSTNSIITGKDVKRGTNIITDFISEVRKAEGESKKITSDFIKGENVEVFDVMIAGEKAKTNLDLLMEIRNKTVDMYKELSRMTV